MLGDLAGAFADLAQISGESFDGAIADLAQMVALMAVGAKAGEAIWRGLDKGGVSGYASAASGAIAGYGALQGATSGPTRGGNVARGAATGASIGANPLLSGTTLGASIAVGAAAGAIWGAVKRTEEEKVNNLRDEIESAAGGLDLLNKKFHEAGLTMREFYHAKSFADLETAMGRITAQLETIQKFAGHASTNLGTFFEAGASALAGVDASQATIKTLEASLGKATAPEEQAKLKQQIAAVTEEMRVQQGIASALAITTEVGAAASGAAVAALFAKYREGGMSITEAMAAVGPATAALSQQLEHAGLSGGAAFDEITRLSTLASDQIAGPVLNAVGSLGQSMLGLHGSGLLTKEMFSGLASQAGQAFDALVRQGYDGNDAMRLMQPTLQTITGLQEQFGWKVDDSTQALLDQARDAGLTGDQYKTAQDKMLSATLQLVEALEKVAAKLGVAVPTAADQARDAINRIPRHVQIAVEFDMGDLPEIPALARGGIVERPTLALIGESGPEAVVPLSGRYATGGTTIVNHITVDASGAYFDDYKSMDRLADRVSRAVTNKAELSRLTPAYAGLR